MRRQFNFNFIGRKKIWFAASGAVIAIGIVAILLNGLNFGIEFQGGTLLDISFKGKAPTVGSVRKVLNPFRLGDSVIQPKEGNELLIRTTRLSAEDTDKVQAALKKEFKIEEINTTTVGPGWGSQVTNGAVKALFFSMLVLLIYISIRFEYKMAVAAIAALFHDIVIVVGIYALVGLTYSTLAGAGLSFLPREVTPNTVAALLTIMGYSLYDTVVTFHRVQENTPFIGKRTYSQLVNDSVNQVFMRSINTSLTSLIPVTVLMLFGGETLKDFAFALFVGLLSGTYSSMFIASPILAMWKEAEPKYRIQRERYGLPAGVTSIKAGVSEDKEKAPEEQAKDSEKPRPTVVKKKKRKKRKKKRR